MKIKLFLSFVLFCLTLLIAMPIQAQIIADTGYVNLELFQNPQPNIQDAASCTATQTIQIDTLETSLNWSQSSRIRGYLIPPQTGYYKFCILTNGNGTLYISSDSTEYHKRLVSTCHQSQWPASLVGIDSVYLEMRKPYYFEAIDGTSYISYIKLRWALPDSNCLQPITRNNLAHAVSKPIRSEVIWEIFENKTSGDFNTLVNTDTVPDKAIKLLSLNTNNFSTSLDHFESRIRGYIIPPISGNYSFYFAADNVGQFWLSQDDSVVHAQLKSEILFAQSDWTKNISSQTLVAGEKYYFEILHYDSTYTDIIKLGWKIPGDSLPVIISYQYLLGFDDSVHASSFHIIKDSILAYPNWTIPLSSQLLPWNTANKNILWKSSNSSIATINSSGIITTVNPGVCNIIGRSAQDTTLADTLILTVTNYYGPYFVKPNAYPNGDGHSWDNAINLTTLLDILNQGKLQQQITVYVAEGSYKPTNTIDRTKSFLLNNIRLVGGYAGASTGIDTTNRDFKNHETVFSGEIGDQNVTYDNSYHVITSVDNTSYWGWTLPNNLTTIDGITVSDGKASCSSYGDQGTFCANDNGGGIFVKGSKVQILNCRITNNSAWARAGGVFTQGGDHVSSDIFIQNTSFDSNLIQQTVIQANGSIFEVVINGYGSAMVVGSGKYSIGNCLFYNNHGFSRTIALEHSSGNIDNCSFLKNTGSDDDIFVQSSSTLNISNSTIERRIWVFARSYVNIKNSTVGAFGGGGSILYSNCINCDNSIVKNLCNSLTDSLVSAQYSILGNTLVGADKSVILSDSIPNYSLWLDTLAYNGGPTPTMRLKNIPFNPAKSMGNPLYLDSLDQRGYLRKDSVSIGAYQWVRPDSVAISPAQMSLCQGDSATLNVEVFPAYADNPAYSFAGLNDSIAFADRNFVHARSAGTAQILAVTEEGGASDTLNVAVTGMVGTADITGDSIVCQGEGPVIFSVPAIVNATSYVWTLPGGASGTSSSNTIAVDFGLSAVSGEISVQGQNPCFAGAVASLIVTVNAKPAPSTITQNGSILHSDAISGNQWYDQNGVINGAINQDYTVASDGSYYVVVTTNSCSSDPSNMINIVTTHTQQSFIEDEIALYPNPVVGTLQIQTTLQIFKIEITEITGRLILSTTSKTINCSGFAKGVYFLRVETERGQVIKKIVVD